MDLELRDTFTRLWRQYFAGADLPICFYYTDDEAAGQHMRPFQPRTCLIGQLAMALRGETLSFSKDWGGCFGGRRYLGFPTEVMPNFEFFLSCGIPGKLEGERYKKTPEIVREAMKNQPPFHAPAKYVVFKQWDKLDESDQPAVVIFYAPPDVLSGLFTLSGFDQSDPYAVIAPFAAGCGSIVLYPYVESSREHPRAVLGTFDVSARPYVPAGVLSFAVPMPKFTQMVANMQESFLITESWAKVRRRIEKAEKRKGTRE
jgi:hypothetical protein